MPIKALGEFGYTTYTSPIYTSRIFGGPLLPPSKNLLSLYQDLGPSRHLSLATWAKKPPTTLDLNNFHMWSLNLTTNHFMVINISCRCQWTLGCHPQVLETIWASIHEDVYVQTLAVAREPIPGHSCSKALSRDTAPLTLPHLLAHTFN